MPLRSPARNPCEAFIAPRDSASACPSLAEDDRSRAESMSDLVQSQQTVVNLSWKPDGQNRFNSKRLRGLRGVGRVRARTLLASRCSEIPAETTPQWCLRRLSGALLFISYPPRQCKRLTISCLTPRPRPVLGFGRRLVQAIKLKSIRGANGLLLEA